MFLDEHVSLGRDEERFGFNTRKFVERPEIAFEAVFQDTREVEFTGMEFERAAQVIGAIIVYIRTTVRLACSPGKTFDSIKVPHEIGASVHLYSVNTTWD